MMAEKVWWQHFRRGSAKKLVLALLCAAVLVQFLYTMHWYTTHISSSAEFVGPGARRGERVFAGEIKKNRTWLGGGESMALFGQISPISKPQQEGTTNTSKIHIINKHNNTASSSLRTIVSHSATASSQTVTSPPPRYDPNGPSWKKGSFCNSFVEHTFQTPLDGVCDQHLDQEHNVKCYHSPKSKLMVYCILESVFLPGPRSAFLSDPKFGLLTDAGKTCPYPSSSAISATSEPSSQARKTMSNLSKWPKKDMDVCDEWIKKTAFLYKADQPVHIYFRMNAYHNLHKAILREGVSPGDFVIIKHSKFPGAKKMPNYLFSEWEKTRLFPEMIDLDELPNRTVCFSKLVVVPYSFSGIPFRCKMEGNIRSECFKCKGRGLYSSSYYSFRQRVISACHLNDTERHLGNRITIVSRTPYSRWKNDNPSKFQRVLNNEDELVATLRENFPHTNVTVAHMEKLDMCEQIRLTHDAAVVTGVHGAGLVHLWWLQEDALALELNPAFETGNPSFRMLSTLAGRRYDSIPVTGTQHIVNVKVNDVIRKLKSITHIS